jgi:ribosomal protein L11 methyltransferase
MEQYFHVTHVGKHIVIKPSWEAYEAEPDDVVLELDPGMAFGTGTHPTTCLCLQGLEEIIRPDTLVFDVGTGSGILAMAAARLGARAIKAVDIDGVAVRTAKENIAKAGLTDRIDVKQGDLLHGTEGQADVIVANILADVIIQLLPDVPGKLKDDGVFLASGVIEQYLDDVTRAAEAVGLTVTKVDRIQDWVGIQMRKK